ncbi:MAG: ABC transporter substrate-binding protein [Deltaproteobacteria bacterium]|nr:ABC transporter substrate-binding protein [Deltaproteobacteria bacterium]
MATLAGLMVAIFLTWGSASIAAEEIRLGAFFDLSGPASNIGTPTKLVAEMAVAEINKAGGVAGRPLKLVIGDTEGNPAKAATLAKKFIYQDKVAAIIGPTRTGTGMTVKPIVEKAGIPTFMTVGGDPIIMGGKYGSFEYVFKSPQRSETAVKRLFTYLRDKKLERVALLYAADSFGKDGAEWMEKLAPEFGITFAARESFGPQDTDMTPQLTRLRNDAPQAVICWTIGPAGAIVAKNRHQLGIELPLFQCHGLPDPKYIELAGAASEGDRMPSTKLLVAAQLPDSDPQKKTILNFIHLYDEVYDFDRQFPINTHSGYAWDAVTIVAEAIRKAGTEPKALRQAIENTKDFVGVSGIYNLTPEDHNGLDIDSMVMVEVRDGGFVLAR